MHESSMPLAIEPGPSQDVLEGVVIDDPRTNTPNVQGSKDVVDAVVVDSTGPTPDTSHDYGDTSATFSGADTAALGADGKYSDTGSGSDSATRVRVPGYVGRPNTDRRTGFAERAPMGTLHGLGAEAVHEVIDYTIEGSHDDPKNPPKPFE